MCYCHPWAFLFLDLKPLALLFYLNKTTIVNYLDKMGAQWGRFSLVSDS